jgi:hypothetical protein
MKRQRGVRPLIAQVSAAFLTLVSLAGCASTGVDANRAWDGPQAPQAVKTQPWQYRENAGKSLVTQHYVIHTTINDEQFLDRLPQVMEGAFAQYRRMAPDVKMSEQPMECFLFAIRPQWAMFTREHTGTDAKVYLQINRGGYTIRDWFVAYFIGDAGTYSVSAHEGWHQYAARNFKNRLPPFLEEGIATQFENIHWDGSLPRWNLHYNSNRALHLRQAIDDKSLWPLDKLISMHAGDVVGLGGDKIEAFYAQNWAFVRFAWDAEGGKYRPAFQKMVTETANGTAFDPTGGKVHLPPGAWRPQLVKPVLEHYFGMDLSDLDKAYQAYVRVLAFEKFNDQWQAN